MKATAAERESRAFAYENPRPEIQALVPPDARRILDLGCASGALGAALKARAEVEVVGIELDEEYARAAAKRLDDVVNGDVEELASHEDLAKRLGSFDFLVAGDVLEHLRDPWSALGAYSRLLSPGGAAVLSLPNVRFWETLWQLGVRGTWPRRLEGIFDRDHLRWFTVADGLALAREAGLEPQRVVRQYRLRPTVSRWDRHLARIAEPTPLRPFFTFQFLILARRD